MDRGRWKERLREIRRERTSRGEDGKREMEREKLERWREREMNVSALMTRRQVPCLCPGAPVSQQPALIKSLIMAAPAIAGPLSDPPPGRPRGPGTGGPPARAPTDSGPPSYITAIRRVGSAAVEGRGRHRRVRPKKKPGVGHMSSI